MEVTFWILMNIFVLISTQSEQSPTAQKAGGTFPLVFPQRLQLFEYESVTVECEQIDGANVWRVMREFHKAGLTNSSDPCSSPSPSCIIKPALERHSGEYWCENDKGERSQALNISITAGLVILDVPIHPVVEGSDVTLLCIHKVADHKAKLKSKSTHIRDFYKNGLHLMTCYSSNMTIQNISKADEGYYKCSISVAGESPESWLAVNEPPTKPNEEQPHVKSQQSKTFVLEFAVRGGLLALLSLLIGVILYNIQQEAKSIMENSMSEEKEVRSLTL